MKQGADVCSTSLKFRITRQFVHDISDDAPHKEKPNGMSLYYKTGE
jgi:hypothetical protein